MAANSNIHADDANRDVWPRLTPWEHLRNQIANLADGERMKVPFSNVYVARVGEDLFLGTDPMGWVSYGSASEVTDAINYNLGKLPKTF